MNIFEYAYWHLITCYAVTLSYENDELGFVYKK